MRYAILAVLSIAFLGGCAGVDYEAVGDRHSMNGDHASAYDAYRRVPTGNGTPELPRKTERALAAALDDFVDQGERALSDGRHEEALRIARKGQEYARDERLRDLESRARNRTVSNAVETGRMHLQQGNFTDAIDQFEKALRYDSNPETSRLLIEAKRGRADELESQARQYAAQQAWDQALMAANAAINFDDNPQRRGTLVEIQRQRDTWTDAQFDAAVAEARGRMGGRDWSGAVSNLEAALRFKRAEPATGLLRYCQAMAAGDAAIGREDWAGAIRQLRVALETGHDTGDAQSRLDSIEAQRQQLVGSAQQSIAAGDWTSAQAALRSARAMADVPEVAQWLRYVTAMLEAETAAQAKQFGQAEAAYQRAVDLGLDDGGVAAGRLAAVKPSTWTITIASVTAMPFKADDFVWDAGLTKALPMERILAGYRADAPGKSAAEAASNLVPEKNLPDLFVQFTLPDGGAYETAPSRGVLHSAVGASFDVRANAYDEREVIFTVFDDDGASDAGRGKRQGGLDKREIVGEVRVKLGDLLAKGTASNWRFGQVYELALTLQNQGTDAAVGAVRGATALDPGTTAPPPAATDDDDIKNAAPKRSPKRDGCVRWRIRLIEAFVAEDDVDDEGREGEADPLVEIRQGGELVFSHALGENSGGTTWEEPKEQPRTVLWVAGSDEIVIRLSDVDPDGTDEVLSYKLSQADLESGTIRLDKGNGSRVVFQAKKG